MATADNKSREDAVQISSLEIDLEILNNKVEVKSKKLVELETTLSEKNAECDRLKSSADAYSSKVLDLEREKAELCSKLLIFEETNREVRL